jgi:hypothetical protein
MTRKVVEGSLASRPLWAVASGAREETYDLVAMHLLSAVAGALSRAGPALLGVPGAESPPPSSARTSSSKASASDAVGAGAVSQGAMN